MSSTNHSFSPFVAAVVGVKKAVVLQHFEFLQGSFITEKVPIKKVWVRRSVKALTATYPYMTPKEIRGCLDGLVKEGHLDTIVNNGSSTDHTKSYQLTEKGWNLIGQPKQPSDLPAGAKGLPAGANRLHKRANPNMVSSNQFIIKTTTIDEPAAAAELLIRSTTEIEGVTLVEKMTVEAEKKQEDRVPPPPSARPAPGESAPRRYDAFDIDREAESLKADPLAAERFARETGTLAAQMYEALGKMVDTFTSDQKTTGYNYNNRIDYRKHFFNLVRKKQEIKRNAPAVQKPFGQTVVDTPSQYRKLSQF